MSDTNYRPRSSLTFNSDGNDTVNDDNANWRNNATPTLTCVQPIKIEHYNFLSDSRDGLEDDDLFEFDFRNGDEILADFAALLNDENDMLVANADRLDDPNIRRLDVPQCNMPEMNNSRIETPKKMVQSKSSYVSSILSDHDYLSKDQMILLGSQNEAHLIQEPNDANTNSIPSKGDSLTTPIDVEQSKSSGSRTADTESAIDDSALTLPSAVDSTKSNAEIITESDNLQAILSKLPGVSLTPCELSQFGNELKKFALQFVERLRPKPAERKSVRIAEKAATSAALNTSSSRKTRQVPKQAEQSVNDASSNSTDDHKTNTVKSNQDGMETDVSYVFSSCHSEPTEFCRASMESESQDTTNIDDENTGNSVYFNFYI